jgi:predicted LPLAT superfamily acyltransferase
MDEQPPEAWDDLEAVVNIGGQTNRRRHQRHRLLLPASLRTSLGNTLACTLLDISVRGARLLVEREIEPGELVTLLSDRFGARPARVAWIEHNIVGVKFL